MPDFGSPWGPGRGPPSRAPRERFTKKKQFKTSRKYVE